MKIVKKLMRTRRLINTYKFYKLQLINNINIIFLKKLYFFLLKSKNFLFKNKFIKIYDYNCNFHFGVKINNLKKEPLKLFFKKSLKFINLYFYKKT